MKTAHEILTDFTALAENEVLRVKTGKAPGPAMRDIIGQWQATIREAKDYLAETNLPPLRETISQRQAQMAAEAPLQLLPEQFNDSDSGC